MRNITKILTLASFIIFVRVAHAESAPNSTYEINWNNGSNTFSSVAEVRLDKDKSSHDIDETNIIVRARNENSNQQIWEFKDGIPDCQVDDRLSFVKDSFEAVDLFKNGDRVVLFAYKSGYFGDPMPIDTKYIAFYKGVKYSLQGSETLIAAGIASYIYKDRTPTPDNNLTKEPLILNYMLKKWPQVSLTNTDNP